MISEQEEEYYESHHDCDSCVDFRKNLRCCREIADLWEELNMIKEVLQELKTKLQKLL